MVDGRFTAWLIVIRQLSEPCLVNSVVCEQGTHLVGRHVTNGFGCCVPKECAGVVAMRQSNLLLPRDEAGGSLNNFFDDVFRDSVVREWHGI